MAGKSNHRWTFERDCLDSEQSRSAVGSGTAGEWSFLLRLRKDEEFSCSDVRRVVSIR